MEGDDEKEGRIGSRNRLNSNESIEAE